MSTRFINATNVQADTNYTAIRLPNLEDKPYYFTIQVVWGAITGTKDCTVKLEASEDGTNYDTLGSAVVMSADNDSTTFSIIGYNHNYIRVVYTENNATNVSTFKAYTSLHDTVVKGV